MIAKNLDSTHDPKRTSWVDSANGHADFPLQNLPFGLFSPKDEAPRPGIAIGDDIIELQALVAAGLSRETPAGLEPVLATPGLRQALRRQMSRLLWDVSFRAAAEPYLHRAADCTLHLPVHIGDYTDFYVGIHHATHVGKLFRPDTPLLPNYKHVPIGYHGRASSIRVSGAVVRRPSGQRKAPDAETPTFGPAQRLDLELELGVWVGRGNELGQPIPIAEAGEHIAGLCLLNDWSARDLQAWEYQPLGPFLAKNFMTTISPWIVTTEALEPFRTAQAARPDGDPRPMDYLWDDADQASGGYALELEVLLSTRQMREQGLPPARLSHSAASHLYWTAAQMVAHHTVGGCDLRPGDLFGTGTISTPDDTGLGSLLELTRGGAQPIALPGGETRTFLQDGDELSLAGHAVAQGYVAIGFGPCSGIVQG